jgi:hypothetical protein
MRKKLLVFIGLLLTLITLPTIKSAQASSVPQITWLPPYTYLSGDDVAYEASSTVNLAVQVLSSDAWGFNVSRVILNFRYLGVNKTYDLSSNPEKIANGDAKVYTISFEANADEFLMGATSHYYRIIVENVNSTTTPSRQLTPLIYVTGSPTFRVYTTEQSDVTDLSQEYGSYANFYPWDSFLSIGAKHLAFDATQKGYLGSIEVGRGNYAAAKTYYEAALDLYKQALAAEKAWEQTREDASLNTTLTVNAANMTRAEADMTRANGEAEAAVIAANGTRLQGEAALMNAYGFFAIGIGFAIGWSLIGVGVIIYAFKRPKPPA